MRPNSHAPQWPFAYISIALERSSTAIAKKGEWEMDAVDRLLSQMTLEEKIGQLNRLTADQAVTGNIGSGDLDLKIWAGCVGGVFNIWGREEITRLQKLAVEETRLGVPLVFAIDALHGHKTYLSRAARRSGRL